MLPRNNDNWWQRGGRAGVAIGPWGEPCLGSRATKEAVLGSREGARGQLDFYTRSGREAACVQQLAALLPNNLGSSALPFYRIYPLLPGLSFFYDSELWVSSPTNACCRFRFQQSAPFPAREGDCGLRLLPAACLVPGPGGGGAWSRSLSAVIWKVWQEIDFFFNFQGDWNDNNVKAWWWDVVLSLTLHS